MQEYIDLTKIVNRPLVKTKDDQQGSIILTNFAGHESEYILEALLIKVQLYLNHNKQVPIADLRETIREMEEVNFLATGK